MMHAVTVYTDVAHQYGAVDIWGSAGVIRGQKVDDLRRQNRSAFSHGHLM